MFSYVVGLVAVVVLFYNPVSQLLSPEATPQIHRTPRPQLNNELLALEEDDGNANLTTIGCAADAYSVHIYSREPLVVYIEGFLSVKERAHLLDIRFVSMFLLCLTISPSSVADPFAKAYEKRANLRPFNNNPRCWHLSPS